MERIEEEEERRRRRRRRRLSNKQSLTEDSGATVKSTPQLASIFLPTWLHFGRVLGAKLEPSWYQIVSKVDPKSDTKNDHLLGRPKIDFWRIFAPTCPPRKGGKCLGFLYIFGLEASWRHLGPKSSPRGLLGPILEDFDLQLDGFWEDLGAYLGQFWAGLVPTTPPTNQSSNQAAKQASNQPTRHPHIPTSLGPWPLAEGT